ncbi:MAG: CDP-glycerol glycerophosphotransferase family protein [Proteobacteria bacterium]|nr:CDP-glycerol glycerophosphotransferase family protein [Pseudomonadota bacterium]
MQKIAFLMLDGIHHVHHVLPIAMELSRDQHFECTAFVQAAALPVIKNIAKLYPDHRCVITVLSTSLIKRIKYWIKQKQLHSRHIIQHELNRLLQYDIIMSPNIDLDLLFDKSRHLIKKPLFFFCHHGAGYPSIILTTNKYHIDLGMFMGEQYVQAIVKVGAIEAKKCAIIGYPKFDIIPKDYKPRIFANDKPVILYNTHYSDASSWWRWGLEILEYFYQHTQFNLIFAPHVLLFRRSLKPKDLPKKYLQASNILVDLGSERSVDMTYVQAADVYLGDISSQVYEFIRTPRPCIFLNAHGIDWRNQPNNLYSYMAMGPVIEQLPQLWKILEDYPIPNPYLVIQEQLFKKTFSITDEPASLRAANAIREFFAIHPAQLAAQPVAY